MGMRRFAGLVAMGAALREPAYGLYVGGNNVSLVGNWMQRTAVAWLAWQLEGSTTWLGIIAFLDLFSSVLVSPFGGVLADRHPRRRILLVTQSAMAMLSLFLFALTWGGHIDIGRLAAIVLVQGLITGINQPARLALVPALVARERLPAAVAINSMVFNGARFLGPAAAGALILGPGLAVVFAANAATFLAFIAALVRMPLEEASPAPSRGTIYRDLADGVRYIARHEVVGMLLVLFGGASVLVRPFTELLPAFAAAVHGEGAAAFAALSAALGVGAIVGAFAVAHVVEGRLLRLALLAPVGMTVTVVLFALTPTLPLALLVIVVAGAFLVGGGISAQSLVQLQVDPAYRGRVMSLYGGIFRSAPGLGALLVGALADRIGLPTAIALGAAAFLLRWTRIWRRRRRLGTTRSAPPHAGARAGKERDTRSHVPPGQIER